MEAAVWLMEETGLDHQRRDLAERRMEVTVVIQLVEMVARLMVETADWGSRWVCLGRKRRSRR